MVVASKNTVYSVFYLILDFISISCLFIMMGAEFLGMIMLIVYVGAVAVLFLFVVMMLNVTHTKNENLSQEKVSSSYVTFGSLISIIIFLELIIVVGGWKYKPTAMEILSVQTNKEFTNTHVLGNLIYTDYIHLFQLAGLILLVAMIGAVVLTFRKREGVKKQNYFKQISRERKEGVTLLEVESNKGISLDD